MLPSQVSSLSTVLMTSSSHNIVDCSAWYECLPSKWNEIVRLPKEGHSLNRFLYEYHRQQIAISVSNTLTIINAASSSTKSVSESLDVEFENDIEAICWGGNGQCLIVGDSSGVIHFLTTGGDVLYSRRIMNSKFMLFQII